MLTTCSGDAHALGWTGGCSTLAELGTFWVEFEYLSQITGDRKYADKVDGWVRCGTQLTCTCRPAM